MGLRGRAGEDHEKAARGALAGGPRNRLAWSAANPGNAAIRDELAAAVLRHLPLDGDLLDAGCGTGWWLRRLAVVGAAPARLHGLDILEERVAAARDALPGATVSAGDITALPFEDDRFQAVFLFTVLSSLPGRPAVVRAVTEAWRVLAPGGVLIIWEPRVPNPLNRRTHLVRPADLLTATGVEPLRRALTVAPPLARRLGRVTPAWYPRLARVPWLLTHHLYVCTAPPLASSSA